MRVLSLRVVIGALCAACVIAIAGLTLGVSVPIALNTIESNSLAAVTSLGRTAAAQIDTLLRHSQQQVLEIGAHATGFSGPAPISVEDSNYDATTGAPWIPTLRNAVLSAARVSGFRYFIAELSLTDGTRCSGYHLEPTPTTKIYTILCIHPNTSAPMSAASGNWYPEVQGITAHHKSTGDADPVSQPLVEARMQQLPPPPSLRDPQNKQYWASRLATVPNRKAGWSSPVLIGTGPDRKFLLFSTATRIVNATHEIGIAALHFELNTIGEILSQSRLTKGTELFMFDAKLFLVAATSGIPVFHSVRTNDTTPGPGCTNTNESEALFQSPFAFRACRVHASASAHAGLRDVVAASPSAFENPTVEGKSSRVAGHYLFIERFPVIEHGNTLSLAIVTPESDLLGDADTILPITLSVTVGAVIIAATVAFVLVWLVLRPLEVIAVRMGKAARLQPDLDDDSISPMVEIGDLQRSFVTLRDELSRIRAFVPQSLLRAQSGSEPETYSDTDDDDHPDDGCLDKKTIGSHEDGARIESVSASHMSSLQNTPTTLSLQTTDKSHHHHHRGLDGNANGAGVGGSGAKALNLATGVRREKVTVLTLNLRGFHKAVDAGVESDTFAALVEIVFKIAQREKGVVDSFHGDRFIISFNAVRHAAGHSIRAAKVACRIAKALSNDGSGGCDGNEASPLATAQHTPRLTAGSVSPGRTSKNPTPTPAVARMIYVAPRARPYTLPITAGISTGTAQVGNLGSASMKRFSIVGPVVSQAVMLERMCRLYIGSTCLVPQRLFDDLRTAVEIKTVDFVSLPSMSNPSLVASVEGELSGAGAQDEWMYQLQQQQSIRDVRPDENADDAWLALTQGDPARGRAIIERLEKQLDQSTQDQSLLEPSGSPRGDNANAKATNGNPSPSSSVAALAHSHNAARQSLSVLKNALQRAEEQQKACVAPALTPTPLGAFHAALTT